MRAVKVKAEPDGAVQKPSPKGKASAKRSAKAKSSKKRGGPKQKQVKATEAGMCD